MTRNVSNSFHCIEFRKRIVEACTKCNNIMKVNIPIFLLLWIHQGSGGAYRTRGNVKLHFQKHLGSDILYIICIQNRLLVYHAFETRYD